MQATKQADALMTGWVMAGDITDEMVEYVHQAQRREAAFQWRLTEYEREYQRRSRRLTEGARNGRR